MRTNRLAASALFLAAVSQFTLAQTPDSVAARVAAQDALFADSWYTQTLVVMSPQSSSARRERQWSRRTIFRVTVEDETRTVGMLRPTVPRCDALRRSFSAIDRLRNLLLELPAAYGQPSDRVAKL